MLGRACSSDSGLSFGRALKPAWMLHRGTYCHDHISENHDSEWVAFSSVSVAMGMSTVRCEGPRRVPPVRCGASHLARAVRRSFSPEWPKVSGFRLPALAHQLPGVVVDVEAVDDAGNRGVAHAVDELRGLLAPPVIAGTRRGTSGAPARRHVFAYRVCVVHTAHAPRGAGVT